MTTSRHVLLVEDHDDTREAMRCLLEVQGYTVEAVGDGLQAVATALQSRPQVVVIDIGLPGLDGYEVARRLRATSEGKAMRLVALTGYDQPHDRQMVREAGFDAHLVKPVDPDDLCRLLEG
jgi:two-component system, sensor histidine kinase